MQSGASGVRRSEGATAPIEDIGKPGERSDRVGVGSGDENVAKIQLATRWAEQFAPSDDSLDAALKRFKQAYTYIDSVTKLVDPEQP
jgi:hypothetical protein